MLTTLPVVIIIGTILGFLSGLGIGGGSLLIIWLTVVLDMDQVSARGFNLLFFIPSAIVACIIRNHQGNLKWKIAVPAIISGCMAAALCSCAAAWIDMMMLKKIFGCLLIAAGIREVFYRERKAK